MAARIRWICCQNCLIGSPIASATSWSLNQLRGDDFSILKQSGEEAKALAFGARAISIKRLHENAIQKIDARSSSFWAAKNAAEKESTGLGLMDRQRVKMWLQAAYGEIDAVGV